MNTEILTNGFKEALNTIEPTQGAWTMPNYTEGSSTIGKVTLRSGVVALVKITITADEDEIEDCDFIDELPELSRK